MIVDPDLTLKILGIAIPLATVIYTWFATRRKDVDSDFKAVAARLDTGSKRMDQHDLEIQALTHSVSSLPAKEDVHQLQLTMTGMGGDMKAMLVEMKTLTEGQNRIQRTVDGHEKYMREKK